MTPTLDYANTMIEVYLNADDWQPQAIRHYLELRLSERVRMDRERELKEILEDDRKRCNKSIRAN
jgi:hypothetical protein